MSLFGDKPIAILIHVFEEFFNLTFLAHKFLEAEAAIIVSVHPLEKLLHFLPEQNQQKLSIPTGAFQCRLHCCWDARGV